MLGQDLKQRGVAESKHGRGASSSQRAVAGHDLSKASMMPSSSKLDFSNELVSRYR